MVQMVMTRRDDEHVLPLSHRSRYPRAEYDGVGDNTGIGLLRKVKRQRS